MIGNHAVISVGAAYSYKGVEIRGLQCIGSSVVSLVKKLITISTFRTPGQIGLDRDG